MLLCGLVLFYKYIDENVKGCGLGIELIWQSICLGCPEVILVSGICQGTVVSGGAHLSSQYFGGGGRRIKSLRLSSVSLRPA